LIRLVTNAETRKSEWDWRNRSVFVVGDADQFIASGWQTSPFCWTFNKTLAMDCRTKTPARCEVGGKLQGKHSQAANQLIANNTQRIDNPQAHTRSR